MAVNALLSYAIHEGTDLSAVRRGLQCGNLMIDSGAFSAHVSGKEISLDAYASYLERWTGSWDHAITLDVIGDPAGSAANTRKLHARGLPVMPVFTRGDTLAEFDAMVRDVGYVCVGGLVGLPQKAQAPRVRLLQRRAEDLGGGIHALGIGSIATLRATRPYSADSSNATQYLTRFGMISYYTGRTVRHTPSTGGAQFRPQLRANMDALRAHGVDVAQLLRTGRLPRAGPALDTLIHATMTAYACADEHLRTATHVPPAKPGLAAGPQVYIAIGSAHRDAIATLAAHLHGDNPPLIWQRYGRTHTCTEHQEAS